MYRSHVPSGVRRVGIAPLQVGSNVILAAFMRKRLEAGQMARQVQAVAAIDHVLAARTVIQGIVCVCVKCAKKNVGVSRRYSVPGKQYPT
jgi:hypothetical protein